MVLDFLGVLFLFGFNASCAARAQAASTARTGALLLFQASANDGRFSSVVGTGLRRL